jgi:hypothetical protein
MKQIQIQVNSCIFRGKTVFRGDIVPDKKDLDLTADELGVMVPRLAQDAPSVKTEKPAKVASEKKTTAKKTDKKAV